jgi:hypothetical protein
MLRRHNRSAGYRIAVDLGFVTAAFVVAWILRSLIMPALLPAFFETGLYPLSSYLPLLLIALPLWAAALWVFLYRPGEGGKFPEIGYRIALSGASATLIFMLLVDLTHLDEVALGDSLSRALALAFAGLACLLLIAERSNRPRWVGPLIVRLSRLWPNDRTSVALLVLASANCFVISKLLLYRDPILESPLMIGDAQDWVANGLFFLGYPVLYSARPPLFPLTLALLDSVSLLQLAPAVIQILVLLTGLAFYRILSKSCNRTLTALATLAWLTNGMWIWWGATWLADVPAACLLGWSLVLWQRRSEDGRPGYALAGLAAGLSAVTQPIAVLFAIPVLVTVCWHRRGDLRSGAFLAGALLFVGPGIIWATVRMRLVGTLGDVLYRNWDAVGLQTEVLSGHGSFYGWALVALCGIPAVVPILVGLWIIARRSRRSDWAALVVVGSAVIMAFFIFAYGSSSARFLIYLYPFLLVFLVAGLARIRSQKVAVGLAVIILLWGLPLRQVKKWPRILLWPLPLTELAKEEARQIDGVWRLIPTLEQATVDRSFGRSPYIRLHRIRGARRPPRLERELLEGHRHAVHLSEGKDPRHRLHYQTRLGNQLRTKVYHLPFELFSVHWPPVTMERLGLQDEVVLYRTRAPGESESLLVALTPDGRAEQRLPEFGTLAFAPEDHMPVAKAVAVRLQGTRVLVFCGPEGIEPWLALFPFLVDAVDLRYIGTWGAASVASRLGPEDDRFDVAGIEVSERQLNGIPWMVIGRPKEKLGE